MHSSMNRLLAGLHAERVARQPKVARDHTLDGSEVSVVIVEQHGCQLALVGGSAGAGVACEVRVDGVQCRPAFRRGGQLREERGVARLEGRSHVTRVQAFWPAARQSMCLWPAWRGRRAPRATDNRAFRP